MDENEIGFENGTREPRHLPLSLSTFNSPRPPHSTSPSLFFS